jgi:hypothetical protein
MTQFLVLLSNPPEAEPSARQQTPTRLYGPFATEALAWDWYQDEFSVSIWYDREQSQFTKVEVVPLYAPVAIAPA